MEGQNNNQGDQYFNYLDPEVIPPLRISSGIGTVQWEHFQLDFGAPLLAEPLL